MFTRETTVNSTIVIVYRRFLDENSFFFFFFEGGLIPLHNACSFGHAEVVQLLLTSGADPNTRDNWNFTPLHEAAIKGKIDVCIGQKIGIFPKKFS